MLLDISFKSEKIRTGESYLVRNFFTAGVSFLGSFSRNLLFLSFLTLLSFVNYSFPDWPTVLYFQIYFLTRFLSMKDAADDKWLGVSWLFVMYPPLWAHFHWSNGWIKISLHDWSMLQCQGPQSDINHWIELKQFCCVHCISDIHVTLIHLWIQLWTKCPFGCIRL